MTTHPLIARGYSTAEIAAHLDGKPNRARVALYLAKHAQEPSQ